MKKIIVMPTIHVPHVLTKWAASMTPNVDEIIVMDGSIPGNSGQPRGEIMSLLYAIEEKFSIATMYHSANAQQALGWESAQYMGWYTTCRRNIGFLEAVKRGADLIVTLDDDNEPKLTNQLQVIEMFFVDSSEVETVSSSTGWFDPGSLCIAKDSMGNETFVTHRGYPLPQRHIKPKIRYNVGESMPIGVHAGLWFGEPDIDAIERMVLNPDVFHIEPSVKLERGTWAPFDSQSTVFRADLMPMMMCWPHVGRYDDIWASYLARCIMDELGYSVMYGHPAVYQDRNPHDLMKDLAAEVHGMQWTSQLVDILRQVDFSGHSGDILTMIENAINTIVVHLPDAIPIDTRRAMDAWLRDCAQVMK